MDNGASSYRRFRDQGDENGLAEIIRQYRDGLIYYIFSFFIKYIYFIIIYLNIINFSIIKHTVIMRVKRDKYHTISYSNISTTYV